MLATKMRPTRSGASGIVRWGWRKPWVIRRSGRPPTNKGGFLFFPGKTAIGEKIYPWSHGAAHKTLPLPSRVRITNLANGRRVTVRVNDRGPFISGRIIDVTSATAKKLRFHGKGLTEVRVEVLSVGDGVHRIR